MKEPRDPATENELRDAMCDVVRSAESNGVDVEGGYEIRGADERSNWEIQILRLARRANDE